ncbi:TPA: hypothetical protein ACOEHG_004882 [Enterobacter ludwigii]
MNTIPTSLQITLEQHFSDKSFTLFSVMTFAKVAEIDEWKSALSTMINTGAMICVASRILGDMFIAPPPALLAVLKKNFSCRLFRIAHVLYCADPEEIEVWRTSLNVMHETGLLTRVLGDMYVTSLPGDVA